MKIGMNLEHRELWLRDIQANISRALGYIEDTAECVGHLELARTNIQYLLDRIHLDDEDSERRASRGEANELGVPSDQVTVTIEIWDE